MRPTDEAMASSAPTSIWDQIRRCALATPDRDALIDPGVGSVSYGQLWSMLESLGKLLREAGIGAGDIVAVLLPDGVCGLVTLLGAARVCACSPINPALTAEELEADLVQLGVVAVFIDGAAEVPRAVGEKLGLMLFEAVVTPSGYEWERQRPFATIERKPANPRNTGAAILLPTSATTGTRKLVPISQANLQAMLENTRRSLQLTADDRVLSMARLFHTQGILSPLAQLLAGGSAILTQGFDAQGFRRWLEVLRPTWYTCGPTLHHTILSHLRQGLLLAPHALRFVRSGGSPLPQRLRMELGDLLRVPVLDVYGLSETGAVACTTVDLCQSGLLDSRQSTVGRGMGAEIAILGSNKSFMPPGGEGEVLVRGPAVISGYLNNEAADREAFLDGWFRTGDLGHLDEDGFLFITGRLKEMVNRGGQKIIPNEVDAVFLVHESVSDAAAFGVPHPTLGEDIACAVVLKAGFHAGEKDLRDFVAKTLAAYKVPRRIYLVDSIPRGATGKPQRFALRESLLATDRAEPQGLRSTGSSKPGRTGFKAARRNETRRRSTPIDVYPTVEGVWDRHVKAANADRDADFFVSGGDSLSAVCMLTEVETLLGLERGLSQAEFFGGPTLANLNKMVSEALAGQGNGSLSSQIEMVPIQNGQGGSPLLMIPPNGEEGSRFRRLCTVLGEAWPAALVRPQNSWHRPSVRWIEESGAESAAAIRAAFPNGPYLLGGYCSGGVIAFETARQLEETGEVVLLVLFDVPMPGVPHVLRQWPVYQRALARGARAYKRDRKIRPLLSLMARVAQRGLWLALRCARPTEGGVWRFWPVRGICALAQRKYLSFYSPAPTEIPILHFMARDEEEVLLVESLRGWEGLGVSAMTTQWVPGDHVAMLSGCNLSLIAEAMTSWISEELRVCKTKPAKTLFRRGS